MVSGRNLAVHGYTKCEVTACLSGGVYFSNAAEMS